MKRFIISFLGALAGVWVSVLIFGVLVIMMIAVAAASSTNSSDIPNVKKHSVLAITLAGEITDREKPMDLMSEIYGIETQTIPLNTLVASIREAADDKHIEGIYLDCKGVSAGLAQIQSIVSALKDFSDSGKWIMAYGDTYTQGDYVIASVSDSLFVNPAGMIDIHGLSSTTMYFKNLLDKAGIDVQVVKVGTYKSAVEPFTLTEMSEANRLQTTAFLNNIWSCVSGGIAEGRRVDTVTVNSWADSYLFSQPAEYYVSNGIADATLYRHEMETLLARASGLEDDKPNLISFDKYALARHIDGNSGDGSKNIAVLYALGDITESGEGGIESDKLVPQILDLAENDNIDALVLRVNSGGGSAYASEQIWEALQQFKSTTGKPFYVSMGDVAASGGYYISCGADRIYAEPVTLTGSIGIFGLIPSAQKLLNDKIGINTATVTTNEGQFPNLFTPMTQGQRSAMQAYVDRGYELFVKRCADGRGLSVDSIKAIAEGRVWDGRKAMEIGLVDRMGGLEIAIADIADQIGAADDYRVTEYPKIKFKWWEEILQMGKTVEASAVRNALGENARFYETVKAIQNMDAVQARMDFIEVK